MPIAKRRVLLLYPRFPETYWGLQYSLPVIGRKSFMPPLGLLTVAALCPAERFEFRLVDLNCGPLVKMERPSGPLALRQTWLPHGLPSKSPSKRRAAPGPYYPPLVPMVLVMHYMVTVN